MKNYLVSELAPGVYAAAIADTNSWDMMTYTNFYILRREGQTVLIDAGMKTYEAEMQAIFREIGIKAEDISHLLLTHGHHDHVDGANSFTKAAKYIHALDMPLVGRSLARQFTTYQPVREFFFCAPGVEGLEVILVNSHTPGSVAIYDPLSTALFVGDFFCFFGEELPEGALVSKGEQCREESYQYVADQAANSPAEAEKLRCGLGKLLEYRPGFLCTGHGVILKGDIQEFLTELWKNARGK